MLIASCHAADFDAAADADAAGYFRQPGRRFSAAIFAISFSPFAFLMPAECLADCRQPMM